MSVVGRTDVVRAAFAGVLAGTVAWVVLWEAFAQLHPRFSKGRGADAKVRAIFLGPPLVALVAAVLAR